MCISTHWCWNFRLRAIKKEFWLIETSLRQEKSVFSFLGCWVNHSISQVVVISLSIHLLECKTLSFITFNIKKAFTSSWVLSKEACVESLLVLEDQPSQTVCHKLEASHLGSSELVDRNDQKHIERSTN